MHDTAVVDPARNVRDPSRTSFSLFHDAPSSPLYTLSLHDALPISDGPHAVPHARPAAADAPDTDARDDPLRASVSRSEEHTSELQSQSNLVCRLLLEKKKPIYA